MMFNKQLLRILDANYHKAINNAIDFKNHDLDAILQYQNDKFLALIKHAIQHVPYYKEAYKKIQINSVNDISSLPFLTKEIIKGQESNLKAVNLPKKRYRSNSTSGSTGKAMFFFSDKKTDVVRHACAIRGNSWAGYKFGEPVVIIWGAIKDTNKSKGLRDRLVNSSLLFNTEILSSFDMTEDDVIKYIEIINKKKPSLVIGYPSSLEYFSNYILEKKIAIHQPKGIITGGETLHEYQREIVQKAFQAKVLNRYGCRDVGHIANECDHQNGLHISMDHVIVEVVNEKGEICKPGELGEIVVTDLDNYVFPFIRYKIGDIGILTDEKCACGRELPMLQSVQGRSFDLIIGSNGNRILPTYWSIRLKYNVKGVNQFQIIQKNIEQIFLKIMVNEDYNAEEEEKIRELFREKMGFDTKVNIEVVDKIETTKSGKFRWVISALNEGNDNK